MIKKKINSSNEGYELYEYIFNTQNEQLSYPYSEEEEPIKFATGIDKKYYTVVKKWDNFITKVRATTELNKSKPFSQKYPIVATKIENSAKLGYNFCVMPLQEGEREALEAEGFTVEIYSVWGFRISW